MKNYLVKNILLVLIIALLGFSCSDDDEGESGSATVVGSWTYQSADLSITIGGMDYVEYLTSVLGVSEDVAQDGLDVAEVTFNSFDGFDIIFTEAGTYTVTQDGSTEEGTWSLNDAGTVLSLGTGSDAVILDVLTLNESTFSFGSSATEEDDFDGDGVTEELAIELVVNLTR